MPMTILTMPQVNNLISEHFIKIFGNVIEHYPAAAIGILKNRPFHDHTDMITAFYDFLDRLTLKEKRNVLQQYPDLVGHLADLSPLRLITDPYQTIIGSERLTIEDKQKLSELNRRYKEKFGFPFIISGKNNINDALAVFSEMETRIDNNVEEEVELAMDDVKRIAKLRIYEILQLL